MRGAHFAESTGRVRDDHADVRPNKEKRHDPIPHDHSEAARGQARRGRASSLRPIRFRAARPGAKTGKAVSWQGQPSPSMAGTALTASSTIVYEIEPGKRLGWHTDATEETQYIIAGHGKLYLEDGCPTDAVGPRQRVRAADAEAPRPREHRQGGAARGRLLRRRDAPPSASTKPDGRPRATFSARRRRARHPTPAPTRAETSAFRRGTGTVLSAPP